MCPLTTIVDTRRETLSLSSTLVARTFNGDVKLLASTSQSITFVVSAENTGDIDSVVTQVYDSVVVAFMSIIILYGIKSKLGNRIESGLNLIISGVFFNALALVWDIVFMYSPSLPQYLASVHHLFMILGMGLFVFAAYKFSLMDRS